MGLETKQEVLDWYEKQDRALTNEFIANIPWHEVRNTPVDPRFIPVMQYMRDVETMTDMYHREMCLTPTGKDPVISKFMERWGVEEITHGEVINRFLNELGHETDDDWQTQVRQKPTRAYHVYTYLVSRLTNLVGKQFTATHMTFGAIHEMTTAQSYRRLMDIAKHPVLDIILPAIIREEAAHTQFYWSVARIELNRSNFSRRMARWVLDNFYVPVGQGSKPRKEAESTVSTLFAENDAYDILDKTVTQRVRQLPGFEGFTTVNETIGGICRAAAGTQAPSLHHAAG